MIELLNYWTMYVYCIYIQIESEIRKLLYIYTEFVIRTNVIINFDHNWPCDRWSTLNISIKTFMDQSNCILQLKRRSAHLLDKVFWFAVFGVRGRVMVFNATFNNISFTSISWRSVLFMEETGEHHRPVASHRQRCTTCRWCSWPVASHRQRCTTCRWCSWPVASHWQRCTTCVPLSPSTIKLQCWF